MGREMGEEYMKEVEGRGKHGRCGVSEVYVRERREKRQEERVGSEERKKGLKKRISKLCMDGV